MQAIRNLSVAISFALTACLPSAFDGAERAERARQATSRTEANRGTAGHAGASAGASGRGRAGSGAAGGSNAGRGGGGAGAGRGVVDQEDAGQADPPQAGRSAAGRGGSGSGGAVAGKGGSAAGSAGPPPAAGSGGAPSPCGDTEEDVKNCGMCGHDCSANMALASCSDSMCVRACTAMRGDCNMDLSFGTQGDGCETALGGDVNNCGGCRVRCERSVGSIPECSDGRCFGISVSVGSSAPLGAGLHGGLDGGSPYEQACGRNSVLVGFDVAGTSILLGMSAVCAPLVATGVIGNLSVDQGDIQEFPLLGNMIVDADPPIHLQCGQGEVVSAIDGAIWNAVSEDQTIVSVKYLALTCSTLSVDEQQHFVLTPSSEISGGSPTSSFEMFHDSCPEGQAVVGLRGRSGAWIDAVQALCAPLAFAKQTVGTFEAEP